MKSIATFVILFAITFDSIAQKEDVKYAAFNIISSGLVSSSVGCFHKPKNQSLGKTFANAFLKGCLGGSINYASKKLIEQSSIHTDYAYVWPARLVHSVGTSIVGNGARNERIFNSFEMDVYFAHLYYDGNIHSQIDPITLGSAIIFMTKRDFKFNFSVSASTGSIVFDKILDNISVNKNKVKLTDTWGENFGNTFFRTVCSDKFNALLNSSALNEAFSKVNNHFKNDVVIKLNHIDLKTTNHELIHTFQYAEYSGLNGFYSDKIKSGIKQYVYVDLNFGAIYVMSSLKGYANNHFEKEADFFGFR